MLDAWQQQVLVDALGEREDGKWAAFEVGLVVPRQNGKGSILEARELAGLFLFGEELILHSAHEFKTAAEAFRRVLGLVQSSPDLDRRVQRVRTSHGDEGIELRGGQRLRFVARSTGSGRGFSGDTIILDESYNLTPEAMAALLPTMAARPNGQLWYTSSAPSQLPVSGVLRRLCKRGREGSSQAMTFLEFCAERDADLDDREAWAAANPSMGIRIEEEFIEREREALGDEEFARERLGVWYDEDEVDSVIPAEKWKACFDPDSRIVGARAFAFDVTPDGSAAAIGVAGNRADGRKHIEVVEHKRGTKWLPKRLAELREKWQAPIVCDPAGPAGRILKSLDFEVDVVNTREHAQACGALLDGIVEDTWRHLGTQELNDAVAAASKRDVGDGAWLWSRKGSLVDISPLVAVTVAAWRSAESPDVAGSVW